MKESNDILFLTGLSCIAMAVGWLASVAVLVVNLAPTVCK